MGYGAARKAGAFGTGVIEVPFGQLKQILTEGWSTGLSSLRCASGIPIDAQISAATITSSGAVKIYFRCAALPTHGQPHPITPSYQGLNIQADTAGKCLALVRSLHIEVPAHRKRGRVATWLRRGRAEDARIDGIHAAYETVVSRLAMVFPDAVAAAEARVLAATKARAAHQPNTDAAASVAAAAKTEG